MAAGKFSFTGSGELRVRSWGRTLAAAGDVIAIGDRVFRLGEVDRVAYHAAARLHRASYSLGLARGPVRCRFGFDASSGELGELEDARETWRRLVELVESAACPRIALRMAEAITAGDTARFGGGGHPGIDADAEGLRGRHWFAAKVPWGRVLGSDLRAGQVRVWTGGREPGLVAGMAGWNAVVLPRVVGIMVCREKESPGNH
ncbi:hypothetical protein ACIOD2_06170 [Amycolatopsis sp. NPDC088138]|uniref:hypothetical protein n=1 Tax=Amycolatopsis sp. NPDC088138 TaxID=3363938 RepID=UPI00381EFDEF